MHPLIQQAALGAVLAAGAMLAGRFAGLRGGVLAGLGATAVLLAVAAGQGDPAATVALDDAPLVADHDGYVGSGACRACHPSEYATWEASYHRRMTQQATPDSVVAPFEGVVLEGFGSRYELARRGDSFWVDMPAPGEAPGTRVARRVVMTTGSHHEQDFWLESGPGRAVEHFPFVWRIAEQRWVPNGSTFVAPPSPRTSPPHVERGGWNRNCIQCHATGSVPAIGAEGAATTVAELGIACEACHGPGGEHARVNRDPQRRYALHQAAARGDDAGATDETIVNPRRLPHDRASEVCGQCHLVSTVLGPRTDPEWNERGFDYRPGARLEDTRTVLRPATHPEDPQLARAVAASPRFLSDRFWSDGMVRVSGREFHGLAESKCYTEGALACTTCHRMHGDLADHRPAAEWADDQLAPSALDAAVCATCHAAIAADVEAHSHHRGDGPGSGCYDCHMPHTTYGLLKGIRSHQITVPTASESAETGRPNACNLCHLDKPLAWTASHLDQWWGIAPPSLDAEDRQTAAAVRWALAGDAGQRALLAWHLGRDEARATSAATGRAPWTEPLLARLLDDPYDAVRFVAEKSWRSIAGNETSRYDFLAPAATRMEREAALSGELDARDVAGLVDPGAVLLDAGGRVDRARLEAIAAGRDDRPVELRE